MNVFLALLALLSLAAAQNPSQCRENAMTCVLSCMDSAACAPGDRACIKLCRAQCTYTCPLTREIWTPERTAYCCACDGVRC